MHTFYQPYPHDYQWTKDHPLEQVIGEPSRPVLTRNQLKTDGDMCIYALTVSILEPKTVKEALTDPAWIESMPEELHQFIRLDVWELVPLPDGIKPLPLKWLFKNKHDEENTVYVDYIIFGSTDPRYATLFSDLMKSCFEMSMMGEMTFFLGLQVNQSPGGIFINQCKYLHENLKKYGLNTFDNVGTPMVIKDKLDLDQIETPVNATKYRSMIGALMYLTSSRHDIVHATCVCARHQAHPTEKHLKELKGSFVISKEPLIWVSAIAISCNPGQHFRTKHIAVRYHFIKEHVEKGTIEMYFVKTDYQLADIFTKTLPVDRFNYLVRRLGMRNLCPQELDRLAKLQKPDISYLHVFGALCYPKNDREDIGKLGEKGDIRLFIGYSANFVAYRVYNWRTRKIMEMMNVTFDELSAMAFEQNSSRPKLQSTTSG
nr:hypothetical protein [Tanacetum cinerariifolium]